MDYGLVIRRLVIMIFVVCIVFVGGTYAWYSYTSSDIAVNGTTSYWCNGSTLKISITSNNNLAFSGNAPVSDFRDANYSTITVRNNESRSVDINLYLTEIEISSALINENFRYVVTNSSGNTILSQGDFGAFDLGLDTLRITRDENGSRGVTIGANTSTSFRLYLYINDASYDQSFMSGKSFSALVKGTVNTTWCNSN